MNAQLNAADRKINLGTSTYGNQNRSIMSLYLVKADFIRRGRLEMFIPAFSPELAVNKLARKANIDIGTATAEKECDSAFRKHYGDEETGLREFTPSNFGRNLGKQDEITAVPLVPPMSFPKGNMEALKEMKKEWEAGFLDRMNYTGRQRPETRAKNSHDPKMFLLGYRNADRRIKASKPKSKKRIKVAS